jgi:hypothetical protein
VNFIELLIVPGTSFVRHFAAQGKRECGYARKSRWPASSDPTPVFAMALAVTDQHGR